MKNRQRHQTGICVAAGISRSPAGNAGRAQSFLVAVVPVVAPAPATATMAMATTSTATPPPGVSRLQTGESGESQGASQQPKDAAASGGVIGVGHLLRELLQIHFETSSLIA
jgi:hypothetical protein